MKITLEQIHGGEDEIVIRYRERTAEIDELLSKLDIVKAKLSGIDEKNQRRVIFSASDVLYFESVEGRLFAYKEHQILLLKERLEDIAKRFSSVGMVQCSRTMIINLYKVEHLEILPGAKIMATMQNGEKVLITRTYAGLVREQLKRGRRL